MGSVRLFASQSGFTSITSESATYNLGVEFYVTKVAWLTQIWFHMPDSAGTLAPRQVSLWRVTDGSSGTQVVPRTAKTPDGFNKWVPVDLATPYQLVPNQRYRADYRIVSDPPFMGYVATANYFSSGPGGNGTTNDFLVAPSAPQAIGSDQGSFTEGPDVFPDTAFNNTSYGIDVTVTDIDPTGPPTGSAAFDHKWSLGAAGVAPVLTVPTGAANFTHTWNVQASGQAVPVPMAIGSANFRHIWALAATGEAPSLDVPEGSAVFTHRWAITAKSQSGDGNLAQDSPIRMQIGTYPRDHIRQRATDLMSAAVRISRPGVEYDPVTRRDTSTEGDLIYEGPARIWEVPAGSQIVIGEEEVTVTSTYLSIPFWVQPLPESDDLIVVTQSDDEDLIGRSLDIISVVRGGGLRASRRFQVRVSASRKSTW